MIASDHMRRDHSDFELINFCWSQHQFVVKKCKPIIISGRVISIPFYNEHRTSPVHVCLLGIYNMQIDTILHYLPSSAKTAERAHVALLSHAGVRHPHYKVKFCDQQL